VTRKFSNTEMMFIKKLAKCGKVINQMEMANVGCSIIVYVFPVPRDYEIRSFS
jgi:hypothetical protein